MFTLDSESSKFDFFSLYPLGSLTTGTSQKFFCGGVIRLSKCAVCQDCKLCKLHVSFVLNGDLIIREQKTMFDSLNEDFTSIC